MNQIMKDAYQIAENTPKERHSMDCKAIGRGALIQETTQQLCNCVIFNYAYEIAKEINE